MRRLLVLLAVAVLSIPSAHAQCDDEPPTTTRPLFVRKDAYLAGGFVAGTLALAPLDKLVAEELQDSSLQAIRTLRSGARTFYLLGFPGPLVIGPIAYGVGKLTGRDCVADVGLHAVEAVLLSITITQIGRIAAGRERPRVEQDPLDFGFGRGFGGEGSDYQSFPSGHAASAFAAASAITAEVARLEPEYKLVVGGVLYGGASLVALSRMYTNQHWLSDVLAGAAIGTFSGLKMVRYNHTRPRTLIDRILLSMRVAPAPTGGLVLSFRSGPGTFPASP